MFILEVLIRREFNEYTILTTWFCREVRKIFIWLLLSGAMIRSVSSVSLLIHLDQGLQLLPTEYMFPSNKMKNQIVRIHHECPCRIWKSHLRGRNFSVNQGRGLPSPWLNSYLEGEIFLSCMDWFMMDSFSPTYKWIVPRTSRSTSWS